MGIPSDVSIAKPNACSSTSKEALKNGIGITKAMVTLEDL